jgi:hypothetical protein
MHPSESGFGRNAKITPPTGRLQLKQLAILRF